MHSFRKSPRQRTVGLASVLAPLLFLLQETFFAADPAAHASIASNMPAKTVLILGDSLAAGLGLDPGEAFPAILQEKIDQSGWNFRVINAGVSGDTSAGGLRRLDWLLKGKVDVLVLELGANDGLRGLDVDSLKSNLQAIIDRTRQKYPTAQVVIVGMKMPPNLGEPYASAFQQVFPELAKENHAALCPFLLEGVGGSPDLNLPDRIHPSAKGQKILAENVWKTLQPLLAKLNSSN